MCKPTSPCKPYKLQSGPSDPHPRGCVGGVGGEICKSVIRDGRLSIKLINPLVHLICLYGLYGVVGLHLICYLNIFVRKAISCASFGLTILREIAFEKAINRNEDKESEAC